MFSKRLLVTFAAVFVLAQILSFLTHAVWLSPVYGEYADVWRPEAELMSKQWIMLVTGAFYSYFFVYIFARGCEGKGWQEGARYGTVVGLFVGVFSSFDWYALLPIPFSLGLKWFIASMVTSIILGIVTSLVYQRD